MLAAQLDRLAAGREEHVRGKASLLYEPRQAADIDLQTLHAAALTGECPQPPRHSEALTLKLQASPSSPGWTFASKPSASRSSAKQAQN